VGIFEDIGCILRILALQWCGFQCDSPADTSQPIRRHDTMRTLSKEPEVITRHGKPVSVILPIKEYYDLLERLEDAEEAGEKQKKAQIPKKALAHRFSCPRIAVLSFQPTPVEWALLFPNFKKC
jgi:hypothetical protein